MLTLTLCADFPEPTDQDRLTYLVKDFRPESTARFLSSPDKVKNACDWEGIRCDAEDNVVCIDWQDEEWAFGQVALDELPPRLRFLNLSKPSLLGDIQYLKGTIDASPLPAGLMFLRVDNNGFDGEINFAALPDRLSTLNLSFNHFEGTVDFEKLPACLAELNLSSNSFEGEMSLLSLPDGLTELNASSNQFEGEIDFRSLPEGLIWVDLSQNSLSGKLLFTGLPEGLEALKLSGNCFDPIDKASVPAVVQM